MVSAIFVGGSRRIACLPMEAKARIDNVVNRGFVILVGDANGADKAAQQHLAKANYDKVIVYCSGGASRNNIGQWPTHSVDTEERERNFQFYAAKDREMARQADFGLMIWDGRSPGTVLNILRLVQESKKAVLVSVAEKSGIEFRNRGDWETFLTRCLSKLLRDMERRVTPDERVMLRLEREELHLV